MTDTIAYTSDVHVLNLHHRTRCRLARSWRFWLLAWMAALASSTVVADAWTLWQTHDADSQIRVDHGNWQIFLEQYVIAGDDGLNRVAYEDARASGWPHLKRYLGELAQIDPRTLSKDEQMAYWINLYNALTVDLVLRHPGKSSIKRMGKKLLSFGPWDDQVFEIADTPLTLNDIEHRILRPIWRDHRIHYAVNCASIGCPNLSRTAFSADLLEAQLNEAERVYLNHPRGVSFDDSGRLQLSSIFDWYRDDFAATEQGLLDYLAAHHPQAQPLREYRGRIRYEYDWQLNALEP